MSRYALAIGSLLILSAVDSLGGDKAAEKADQKYEAAAARIQSEAVRQLAKEAGNRLATYRVQLSDATKAGDFDRAKGLKDRIVELEAEAKELESTTSTKRKLKPLPKDRIAVRGHEYALIPNKETWGVAQKRCEEMGGHLATLETIEEQAAITALCKQFNQPVWLGASDEETEGKWVWVTGTLVPEELVSSWKIDNENKDQHCLCFWPSIGYADGGNGFRSAFVCEWDK